MSVESRIVSFSLADGKETSRANAMLTGFLSEGWDLVGSGGTYGYGFLAFVKWSDDKADGEDDQSRSHVAVLTEHGLPTR